mmetsp:Transcript_47839/g.93954  ORF Transcript_47839/g.93954 Transcript_47839/m.93954 type:complete len:87 (+) Transcript_47839:1101-1361(+)
MLFTLLLHPSLTRTASTFRIQQQNAPQPLDQLYAAGQTPNINKASEACSNPLLCLLCTATASALVLVGCPPLVPYTLAQALQVHPR